MYACTMVTERGMNLLKNQNCSSIAFNWCWGCFCKLLRHCTGKWNTREYTNNVLLCHSYYKTLSHSQIYSYCQGRVLLKTQHKNQACREHMDHTEHFSTSDGNSPFMRSISFPSLHTDTSLSRLPPNNPCTN